jgi:glycosyltransferase involved in cell wall biosynthesis
MVTRDSTVVFEANALDKPSVTINLGDIEEELPYAATGGALAVYRFADIAPAIKAALQDPATRAALAASRPAFLEAHTGPRDGQATARITACIAAWATRKRLPVPSGTQEPF